MIVVQLLLQYFLFSLSLIFAFYIPGIYLISLVQKANNNVYKYVIAWPVGYSLFILISYLGAWIHLPYITLFIIIVLDLYVLLVKRSVVDFTIKHIAKAPLSIILFGSLIFVSMSFLSGFTTSQGFQMIGSDNGTDAIMHVARIKTQLYAFPPVYTGFAGQVMRGYHYFYDFLLSRFVLFFHFSPEDLYYRLFPLAISLFYGVMIYIFSSLFTKKPVDKILILFFAYFGASFSFFLSFFTKTVNPGNGMGLVQQIELILDPSVIFSAGLLLAGFYVFLENKKSIGIALFAGLILGLLTQLKIYAGIIAIGTLFIFGIYAIAKYKNWKIVVVTTLTALICTAITYLPNNLGVGKLIFSPLFLYGNFMKQSLFNSFQWEMKLFLYSEHHNIPRLIFIYGIAFILFWILALGTRILFILHVGKLLKRKFWNNQNILLLIAIIIPFVIASFFVQSISIFDTVQFLWMMAIFISIPSGIFYGTIFQKLPKIGKYILIFILVFFSVGEVAMNASVYVFHPQFSRVTPGQLAVLHTINQKVQEKDFFVVTPALIYDEKGKEDFLSYPAPLFSALSSRRTYYEYEIPQFPVDTLVASRKNQIVMLARLMQKCQGAKISGIMHTIGSKFLVTTQNTVCKNTPQLIKIATGDNWTFWIVK